MRRYEEQDVRRHGRREGRGGALTLARVTAALALSAAALASAPAAAPAHGPIGTAGDAVCSATGGPMSTIGNTTCLLRATEIIYVTNWGPADEAPRKRVETLSLVNVPTPIDVDDRLGADLVATVRALGPGEVSLEVGKTATASGTLPVSIVAHANDPADTSLRYVFGYDARGSTAPGRVVKAFAPRAGGLGVSVAASAPGSSLALIGSRIQSKKNSLTGEREDSLAEVRATFAPVPSSIDADLSIGEPSGNKTMETKLTVNRRSRVSVDFAGEESTVDSAGKRQGTHTDLEGTLDQVDAASLPARSATVKLVQSPVPRAEPPGSRRTEVTTTTSGARVARGEVTLTEHPAGDLTRITSKTDARLEHLPSSSTVTIVPKRAEDATASPPIAAEPLVVAVATAAGETFGLVDVAHAQNGEPQRLTDDQYAHVLNDAARDYSSAAARIRGLDEATIRVLEGELVDVRATSAGGPFHVLAEEKPGIRVDADIRNLPATVELTLQPKANPTLKYSGSDPIGSAKVNVHDEAGIARSEKPFPPPLPGQIVNVAKDLEVVATSVPTDLTATLDADAKKITLAATDAKPKQTTPGNPADVGRLDVRLSTGALAGDDKAFVDGLGTTKDGVLVRDRLDRYVIFARISSLHGATLELDPDQEPLHVGLEHGPTYTTKRPLAARVEQQVVQDMELDPSSGALVPAPGTKSVDAEVHDLPGDIDLKLREETTPTIEYEGSDTIGATTVGVHDDAGVVKSPKTGVAAKDLLVTLTTLPTKVTASFATPTGGSPKIDVEARDRATGNPARIGRVEAQLWTRPSGSTSDQLPEQDDRDFVTGLGTAKDGALVRDLASRYVIFVRLNGLRQAHLSLDPQVIELRGPADPATGTRPPGLDHDAGPFKLELTEKDKSVDVQITDVPATVRFVLRPTGTPTLEYTGSAEITDTRVRLNDDTADDGIAKSERTTNIARDLLVKVHKLPASVVANLDPGGKNIELEAKDPSGNPAAIGRVDVQLWSTQANSDQLTEQKDRDFVANLGTTKDGVLVRDVSGRYVVYARISDLKAAKLILDQRAPDVRVLTGSRRDTEVDIANAPVPECSDQRDNDGDGKTDHPDDLGCATPTDDDEGSATTSIGPDEELTATITNRPTCLRFRLARDRFASLRCASGSMSLGNPDPLKNPTAILYEGDQTTGRIVAEVRGLKHLGGRDLRVRMDGVPPLLEAIVEGTGATPDRIEVETLGGDGDVDLVEVRLRKGRVDSGDTLPDDGVLLLNKLDKNQTGFPFDRSVVLARVSGLCNALVRTTVRLRFEVNTLSSCPANPPERPFKVVKEDDEVKEVTIPGLQPIKFVDTVRIRADAAALQRGTVFAFDDSTGATKLAYRAGGEMPSLNLDTNVTGSLFLRANATNVSRKLDLCVHPGPPTGLGGDPAVCNLNAFGVSIPKGPTITAEAGPPDDPANPMTIDFIDCKVLDSGGQCGRDQDPAEFIKLSGLQLRKAQIQLHQVGVPPDEKTNVFLDTDRNPVLGDLLIRFPIARRPDKIFMFARGVQAEDRRVRIGGAFVTGVPTQEDWSGDIDCTGGFDAFAVDNSFIGSLKGPLCDNPDDPTV